MAPNMGNSLLVMATLVVVSWAATVRVREPRNRSQSAPANPNFPT